MNKLGIFFAAGAMSLLLPSYSAAVGQGDAAGGADETIDLTLLFREVSMGTSQMAPDDSIERFIEQKFNVNIDYLSIPAPAQRGHHERLNLLIASGDIPDLFSTHPAADGLGGSIYRNLSSNDQLVNIRDAVSRNIGRWPNIHARTEFPSVHAFETATGELNAIPVKNDIWNHGFVIRGDWLEKLGMEVPQTVDELRDVLRAFVASDPDGTGNFGMTTVNSWWLQHLVTGFTGAFEYHDTGDKFIHTIYQPEWIEGIRYVNSWFDEGLIDPEIFVHQPYRDELGKFTSGKAGVLLGHSSWVYLEKEMRELFPDVKLTALPPDLRGRNSVARYSGPPWYEAVSIYRHTPDPDRVLDIMEFIMEEQDTLFVDGIEGVHYTVEGAKKIKNEDLLAHEGWGLDGLPSVHIWYRVLSSIELAREREKDIESGQRPALVDFITNWDQELKDAYDNGQVVINPAYGRTLLAMDEVGSKPNDVFWKYYNGFLLGEIEPSDENWGKMLKEYWDAGYDRLEKELNQKYYR